MLRSAQGSLFLVIICIYMYVYVYISFATKEAYTCRYTILRAERYFRDSSSYYAELRVEELYYRTHDLIDRTILGVSVVLKFFESILL